MIFLQTLSIIVEVLSGFLLTVIILMQRSRSEGLGLAFGAGMGETLFGARAGNILTKATVILASVFIVNTIILGMIFSHNEKRLIEISEPSVPPISQQAGTQPGSSLPADASTPSDTAAKGTK